MGTRIVDAEKILPQKEGRRVLVYPCCGTDWDWIRFLQADCFVGIDLGEYEEDTLKHWPNLEVKLYGETDAIDPPEIPKADETVLLLKCFDWIRSPLLNVHDISEITQEMWKKFQEENLGSLGKYLQRCEESAHRRVFVVDIDGYESAILPEGYRKMLSFTASSGCDKPFPYCNSRPCERAEPLFDYAEVEKRMPGQACNYSTWTQLMKDDVLITRTYEGILLKLITYVKEKLPNKK